MKIPSIPSAQIVQCVSYFRLSLGIFLLISILFLNSCVSLTNNSNLDWKNYDKIPKELLLKAIKDNTLLLSTEVEIIKVATIATNHQNQKLYLLNYNSSKLCGFLGCLYNGYLDKGQGQYKPVINFYLKQSLPRGNRLLTVDLENREKASGLPCLNIEQISSHNTLQNLAYCFDGTSYQVVENTLTKLSPQ